MSSAGSVEGHALHRFAKLARSRPLVRVEEIIDKRRKEREKGRSYRE
jgi:hypothetical protein